MFFNFWDPDEGLIGAEVAFKPAPGEGTRIYLGSRGQSNPTAARINYRNPWWAYVSPLPVPADLHSNFCDLHFYTSPAAEKILRAIISSDSPSDYHNPRAPRVKPPSKTVGDTLEFSSSAEKYKLRGRRAHSNVTDMIPAIIGASKNAICLKRSIPAGGFNRVLWRRGQLQGQQNNSRRCPRRRGRVIYTKQRVAHVACIRTGHTDL